METKLSREGEHGNVLFLVLIAVILFAALSYAVTSSTRGNDRNDDSTDHIGGAELNQYPVGLRVAIMMMSLDGVDVEDLKFNSPANFAAVPNVTQAVFHPDGGGAAYQAGSPSVMASGAAGTWHFNAEFEIDNIGLDAAASFDGNDVIAFLPGIKPGVCRMIVEKIGISGGVPDTSVDLSASYVVDMDDAYVLPATEIVIGVAGSNGTDSLTGQPLGCFRNNGGEYVYYQVLVDR